MLYSSLLHVSLVVSGTKPVFKIMCAVTSGSTTSRLQVYYCLSDETNWDFLAVFLLPPRFFPRICSHVDFGSAVRCLMCNFSSSKSAASRTHAESMWAEERDPCYCPAAEWNCQRRSLGVSRRFAALNWGLWRLKLCVSLVSSCAWWISWFLLNMLCLTVVPL